MDSQPVAQPIAAVAAPVCSVCHQLVLPQYYFCPNCGNKLNTPPPSTSIMTQAGIYLFSIILPIICFIMITKWPGIKYIKSHDKKTKNIGIAALTLLILSTIVTTWLATVWIQNAINSSVASLNADMSASGY